MPSNFQVIDLPTQHGFHKLTTQIVTCCFSSTTAASGAQEVADLRAPWQKAPEADLGASRGVQATLPG